MAICNDPPSFTFNQPEYCNCTQGYEPAINKADFDEILRLT